MVVQNVILLIGYLKAILECIEANLDCVGLVAIVSAQLGNPLETV